VDTVTAYFRTHYYAQLGQETSYLDYLSRRRPTKIISLSRNDRTVYWSGSREGSSCAQAREGASPNIVPTVAHQNGSGGIPAYLNAAAEVATPGRDWPRLGVDRDHIVPTPG